MTAILERISVSRGIEAAQLICLDDVSWETYECLLRDTAEQHVRITYDEGRMVLMSPLPKHDRTKRWIGRLLETASLEYNILIGSFGSTTWRKRKLKKGLEPDECYYIQNESKIRGRVNIDLKRDPPPDLAIEIEITHFPLERLKIYAKLGVGEVWQFNGAEIEFHVLRKDGQYGKATKSRAMPFLTTTDINRFLAMFSESDENTVIRAFRDWLHDNDLR